MFKLTLLSEEGDLVSVRAEGRITQTRSQAESNPLENLLGLTGFARKVLLDLARTQYIDSSGISWLIVNHKQFLQGGGKLVLHSVPPRVAQVLKFCRMDTVFHLAADETAARALAAEGRPL